MLDTSSPVVASRPDQPQANLYHPHLFEFGKERKSQEEVKDWDQSLREKQLPTEFVSIAYMKDQGTNLKHEFLLIYLLPEDTSDDYSFVCRVERRGVGSRIQALFELSYTCSVHRVLHIQFQRRLDLLRVLELCYSLQESDTSARYTLLQFNCYFMCWMILINLVRGADKWDDRVGPDMWRRILTRDLPQLVETWVPQDSKNTSFPCTCNPLATASHISSPQTPDTLNSIAQHLSFCILKTVLGPGIGRGDLVAMITDSIQTELKSRAIRNQLLNVINSHSSANLLPSDEQLHEAIKKALSNSLSAAATKVLQQDKCADQILWSLPTDSGSPHEVPIDAFSPEFEAAIAKKLHKIWFGYMWDYLRSTEFRSQVQCEPPNGSSNLKRIPGLKERIPQLRIWRESHRCSVVEILGPDTNSIMKSMLNRSYMNFNGWEFYKKRILPVILTDWADIQTASRAVSQDYRILAIYTLLYFEPTRHSESSLKPQAWLRRYFKSSDWSYCLNKCISKAIYDSLVLLDKPSLQVEQTHNGNTIRTIWRYTELYDFVKARIKAHAIRVALARDGNTNGPIASSRVIRSGIHDAIQNIWDSRPTFSEANPV